MRSCFRYRKLCISALVCLSVGISAPKAYASISVLLEEPYGWFSHLSPSGHTAIYLDNVCAETPLRLRLCRSGEFGVVISRYKGIGHHDWIAVPLIGYLYAVEHSQDIPAHVTRADVARLREAYRRHMLSSVAPTLPNGTSPSGNWHELAGASFDRTIFGFGVKSTASQDAELISLLNETANHVKFNGILRNCADFVRITLNRVYPHAIGRNYVAGFGVSSPKSVARSLSHYANKHQELEFRTFRITQVSGTLPRSHPAVTLMEGITKELGIPLALISPIAAGAVATAWLTQGRFAEPSAAHELNLLAPPYSPGTALPLGGSAHNTSP